MTPSIRITPDIGEPVELIKPYGIWAVPDGVTWISIAEKSRLGSFVRIRPVSPGDRFAYKCDEGGTAFIPLVRDET